MFHELLVEYVQGWLCVSRHMSDHSLEDLGLLAVLPQFGIQILEFDLLAPEVVAKAAKGTRFVFLAGFIRESVLLNTLSDRV